MPLESSRSLWSFLAALCVASLGLNWVWEMARMRTFAEMSDLSWRQTLVPCTLASLGDVALTLAVYGLGALAAGQPRWGTSGRWNVYATASVLGAVCAGAYEWYSRANGRWSYTAAMPIVPVLGVGLWPFLQLPLLMPAALWVAVRWAGTRSAA
jgi:hypothetical protein